MAPLVKGVQTAIQVLGLDSDDEDGYGDKIRYEDNDETDSSDDGSDADDEVDEDYVEDSEVGGHTVKRARSTASQGGKSEKHVRFDVPRKDTATVRAEHREAADKRIYELKMQGINDQEVANTLTVENLGTLQAATIGTRFSRLRKKKDQEEYNRLDDELSDWHLGEDDVLHECRNVAESKFEAEVKKLQEKKWEVVAVRFAERTRQKKYTAKACKERFESLLDGTALLPIELDSDQEGRAEMREARIAQAKRARLEEAEAAKYNKDARHRKKQEEKARRRRRYEELAEEKRAKEAAKAEDDRIKAERQVGKAIVKAHREAALQRAREEVIEKKKIMVAENLVYRHYTGKLLKRMNITNYLTSGNVEEEEDGVDYSDSDLEDRKKGAVAAHNRVSALRHVNKEKALKVTEETLLNPRSVMNDNELNVLLSGRKLPPRKLNETHLQVVARLAAADNALDPGALTDLLKEKFRKVKGNHHQRVRRLQEADADESIAGQDGIKSTDLEFKESYEGYSGEFAGLIGDDSMERRKLMED